MSQTRRKLRIVFAAAEAAPFVKTGGLGDVAGSLPRALRHAGCKVKVVLPKYATIAQEYKDRMKHVCSFTVPLGWRNEYCGLEELTVGGTDYLFLDNESYFGRSYPYGFFDDGERFAFFSKAICECLQHIPDFQCDVLHCNDWHTALAPVFLREFYNGIPLYDNVKTVFTIHNIAFQGKYGDKVLEDVCGLAHIPAAASQMADGPETVNYMKGALNYSDRITTVSPTYAEEIKTPAGGEGLDGVLRRRANVLSGIVNGLDPYANDPRDDERIPFHFSPQKLGGKAQCKAALQEELGLTVDADRPLMVMVTRLTRQKGMDLVTYAMDGIVNGGVQLAVLGTGDPAYEDALKSCAWRHAGEMSAQIRFDANLAQRMYAGADLFLMPSLFEPCGISQMVAMRYGTLPVVRETGGLRDTVEPYNQYTGEGCGFSFANFNGDEMATKIFEAVDVFTNRKDDWKRLQVSAMEKDFSWKRSAVEYLRLYHSLHPEVTPFWHIG